MPRRAREQYAGAYYHVFNRGVNKELIFCDDHDRKTFFRIISESNSRCNIRIFAYCLMENHFHLYVQTIRNNIGEFMQILQSQYAQYFNVKHGRVGGLFQDRYKSELVENDSYSLTLVRYIHRNPVEGNITTFPGEYKWSSYSYYLGDNQKWDWLNTDWILTQFHKNEVEKARNLFKEFHLQAGTEGTDPCVPF